MNDAHIYAILPLVTRRRKPIHAAERQQAQLNMQDLMRFVLHPQVLKLNVQVHSTHNY